MGFLNQTASMSVRAMSGVRPEDKDDTHEFKSSEWDPYSLPDFDTDFLSQQDLEAFSKALQAPVATPVTALNDWRPIHQRIKKSRPRRKNSAIRSKDETREGFVYALLRYPLLLGVLAWVVFLFVSYNVTRLYIYAYEHLFNWNSQRRNLRKTLSTANSYEEWKDAAQRLDTILGNEEWKRTDVYAYYNHQTVRRVMQELSNLKAKVAAEECKVPGMDRNPQPIEDLKFLLESCIKNNFVGIESPRLYSETYIGTKDLVQKFIERVEQGLSTVLESNQISQKDKSNFFRHLELNYGRTALCLSGGATFSYYHFGVIKALLDAKVMPQIITGTSGGALVAALIATRTDEELKKLLVPALAYRITACHDSSSVWMRRWWKTGARFDSLDWARQCSWFTMGSLTFKEAYQRTGRILNVSCVPSDPHSPTMLNNHITSPDCVIWSAVLASAAVPGILNPIVLMRKNKNGSLSPYSFGNKWKDGSLRTDIPLKALNIHFNVNFSIVSQVNPHINLFFFSPRGSPGKPVNHRKGRGWRGGFLGSSLETAIKLDLQKYLKILRHLELLPRPMGQDWSELWLQRFSGNVTIWPKTITSDYWNILSDPSPKRLARMLRYGERSCWPRIRFIANRMKIERVILEGLRMATPMDNVRNGTLNPTTEQQNEDSKFGDDAENTVESTDEAELEPEILPLNRRKSSIMQELGRQVSVLWHDEVPTEFEDATTDEEDDVSGFGGKED